MVVNTTKHPMVVNTRHSMVANTQTLNDSKHSQNIKW